jgi:hypothetical protein
MVSGMDERVSDETQAQRVPVGEDGSFGAEAGDASVAVGVVAIMAGQG